MENFSWFDVIILSLILILGLKGVINGLIKELSGLIGVVGGIFLASRYADKVGAFVDSSIYSFENKAALYLVGFVLFLVLFWIVCIVVGQILAKALSISGLGAIDKILGFFVGSAKIFLVVSIFLAAVSKIDFAQQKVEGFMKNSIVYPLLLETGSFIISIDPNTILPAVEDEKLETLETIKEEIQDAIKEDETHESKE